MSILTLDTKTPLANLCNMHGVTLQKIQKMAEGLRKPENNPEGKTLAEIYEVAKKQHFGGGVSVHFPALAWNLLGAEAVSSIRDILVRFLKFACEQGITVLPRSVRPQNPHATQTFVRRNSQTDKLQDLAKHWDHHGSAQELELGEVRYSTREVAGEGNFLVNVAVAVKSFRPHLMDLDIPHVTIMFDPKHAAAVDSNKLWNSDHKWPKGHSVHSWDPELAQDTVVGIFETGVLKEDALVHQMPEWLSKHC